MKQSTQIEIRNNVIRNLPDETVTFLFSGCGVRRSADAEYPFSANRNFRYVTGIEEQEAIVVLDKQEKNTVLFIRDIDPNMEKWVGYFITKEEATAISGIQDVRYLSEFEGFVESVLERNVVIGVDMDHDTIGDQLHSSGLVFADSVDIENTMDVFEFLVACRQIKHPEEIEKIKHAVSVTDHAIKAMLEEMKPGNNENDMAARFLYEGNKAHGDLMFDTICASGSNATVLHYVTNDKPLNDGEMVLLDLGIRVNGYGADISRTYPINGIYSDRQKEVYQAVLDTFHLINASVKPGVSILELNEIAKVSLGEACVKLGLIEDPKDVGQYYYHSIGHSLGLDTHDVWLDRSQPLVPGNVITNEPGLYIAEEGIGVRIETDLLVTDTGCEDLAPQILREINEIEAYLAS